MTIGIDARLYGEGLGLGRYVSKLIEHLERVDQSNSYVIFLRKAGYHAYHPTSARFRKVCADVPWYSWSEQLVLPWLFLREHCDLLHVPHFNIPLLYPRRLVVTIHDCILLKHPQSASIAASTKNPFIHWMKYQVYRCVILMALKRACRVITVSLAVADDLRVRAPWANAKIGVIYEAADLLPASDQTKQLDGIYANVLFFLYAGNAYPHKNIETLLTAMKSVHALHPRTVLILCGQEDHFQQKLLQRIYRERLGAFIQHRGRVSEGQLRWLYEHAVAVILPSREEGFGLQIVEAFVHSCPVVASAIPAYQEVAGDAALFVDTTQPQMLADALLGLMADRGVRSSLIEKGRKRAELFSWDKTATQTYETYKQCFTS